MSNGSIHTVNELTLVLKRRRRRYRGRHFYRAVTLSCAFFCRDSLVSPAIVFHRTLYILGNKRQSISHTPAGVWRSPANCNCFAEIKIKKVPVKMCNKLTLLSLTYVIVFVSVVQCDSTESKDFFSQGNYGF